MKRGFWIVVKNIIKKADVVLEILDARMPELTRNEQLEKYALDSGKKLILVMNKKDLVSDEAIKSIEKRYSGRDCVIVSSKSHKDLRKIIGAIKSKSKNDRLKVAVIGYPNTGKSSLINILSKGGKAKTSLESGLTRGAQYISGKGGLMLIDTPGVVPYEDREEVMLGLTSAISPDKLSDPESVAYELLLIFKKNNPAALQMEYGLDANLEPQKLLAEFGMKKCMLMKGCIVDERRAAIRFLTDWHKGKIRV